MGVPSRIIPPWVFASLLDSRAAALRDSKAGEVHRRESTNPVWLYSGNLGRAHDWRTILDAQRLVESTGSPWRLVFQGGGPSWPAAQDYARELGLRQCDWRPYVTEEELPASLLAADVLVVTQKPETCGLLWPSKLALVTSLPRAILWVGPTDRAIARDLGALPQSALFSPGDPAPVARWLADTALTLRPVPRDPGAIRQGAIDKWLEIILSQKSA
jgi:glycosyltransferase involved in cell wall biosynthesis